MELKLVATRTPMYENEVELLVNVPKMITFSPKTDFEDEHSSVERKQD